MSSTLSNDRPDAYRSVRDPAAGISNVAELSLTDTPGTFLDSEHGLLRQFLRAKARPGLLHLDDDTFPPEPAPRTGVPAGVARLPLLDADLFEFGREQCP